MAGFGMKRSFPGEWGGGYGGEKKMRPQGQDFYGGGQFGNTDYSRDFWNGTGNFQQGGNNGVDFTDDYSAFYGNPPRGRGGQRGRGRGRGGQNSNQNRGGPINLRGGPPRGGGQQRGGSQQMGGPPQRGRGRGRGQRGMPPNQFGTPHGRGRGKNNNVPPVHSLAKAKPTYPDITNMSMAEKLHRFCLFLRHDDSLKINSIQTIMNAITSSKLGLKADYEAEELTKVAGKAMYTGVLKLSDVFLARAVCPNKKELKQEVFQKSLNLMLSKTVAEIYNLVDPGTEAIRAELEAQMRAESELKAQEKMKGTVTIVGEAETAAEADVQASLCQLVNTLNNMKTVPESAISVIEQAMTQAKCPLKHIYSTNSIVLSNNRYYYMGQLAFGGVVIGRGNGMSKKLCKNSTYTVTLQHLKAKSLKELMVSLPEEPIPEMEHERRLPNMAKPSVQNLPMEERFAELTRSLVNLPYKKSNVNVIDISAMQNGLTPMLVYKTPANSTNKHALQCDFYLDKVLIASSEEGMRRKECMLNVYNQAWEILTSTTVETLLSQHKRITDEELEEPDVIDVVVKGSGKVSESNIPSLKRFQPDISQLEGNSVESMVIIENSDWSKDRIRNAFCILLFSATQNQLVMQWETEALQSYYSCTMKLQGKVVGHCLGKNKHHARNLAATDALFKLYETQDVIKLCQRDDEAKWIPYDTIVTLAENLKEASVGEEPVIKNDEQGNPLADTFIMKVLSSKLKQFAENNLSDELIIGPGMNLAEIRELRIQARELNLICDTRQHQGKPYTLIYEKLPWVKLCEKMKITKQPHGKFVYVERTELPKYSDIEDNIVKKLPVKEEEVVVEMKTETDVEVKKEEVPF